MNGIYKKQQCFFYHQKTAVADDLVQALNLQRIRITPYFLSLKCTELNNALIVYKTSSLLIIYNFIYFKPMPSNINKKTTLLLAAIIIFLASCKKDKQESEVFEGTKISMGNGKAWSWIQMKPYSQQPEIIGISFTQDAFVNLSAGSMNEHDIPFELDMPFQKEYSPFNHIVVDWNPHGHTPVGIYDKPHFDFHFYMITEAERKQIPDYNADSTKYQLFPLPDYFPTNYFPIPEGEKMMGKHWVDVTSPELNPTNLQPFTQTFIYGSYNGKVTFYEPMATLSFMTTTNSFTRDIPQPLKYAKPGYYPTQLSITKSGNTTEVKLINFVYHQQS